MALLDTIYDVGFVIPTRGTRPAWLRGTLDSIRMQSGVTVRILIVTPNPEFIRSIAENCGAEILHSVTPGISAAVNEGWTQMPGLEYLAWLGDDDLLAPGALRLSIDALNKERTASATYGLVRYIDGEDKTLFVVRPGNLASKYLVWGKDLVPQPGAVFRATAVNKVGGLDNSLKYAMDFDLFIKLRSVGRLIFLPCEVAAFRLHLGSITGSNTSGVEAENVRSRAHSARVNHARKRLSPLQRVLDRVLYRVLRAPMGLTPQVNGMNYTEGPRANVVEPRND